MGTTHHICQIETAIDSTGYTGELSQGSAVAVLGWALPMTLDPSDGFAILEPKAKVVTTQATDSTNGEDAVRI